MKVNAALIKNKNIKNAATDKSIVTAFLSVASGLVSGGVLFALNKEVCVNEIHGLFTVFMKRFENDNTIFILITMLLSGLIYYAVIIISGTSIAGKNIILFYTILNFSSLSMIASYLYSEYNLKGLEYCLLVFYPGKMIYLFSSLLAVKNAIEYCNALKCRPVEAINSKKRYICTNGIIFLLFASGITIDFIMIKTFSSLFTF